MPQISILLHLVGESRKCDLFGLRSLAFTGEATDLTLSLLSNLLLHSVLVICSLI